MLRSVPSLFIQRLPMGQNSSVARTARHTSEQASSYESTTSSSSLSDKKIEKSEALNCELYHAIANDLGIEKIKELLKKGADPNAWIRAHETYPMLTAIKCGQLATVKVLLGYKANIDGHDKELKSGNPYTNLAIAANQGAYDIVKLLLKKGANPNIQVFSCFYTALSQAALKGNKKIAELLIVYGAKIEGWDGDSPLSWSIIRGNADNSVVRLLLENGANPAGAACDDRYNYRQPCFRAIHFDNAEALSLLLSYDTKDTLKNMIDQIMLKIVGQYSIKCMQLLLDKGYDINGYYFNHNGIRMTLLMMALNYKKYSERTVKFITFLLENNADPNVKYKDDIEITLIEKAIKNKRLDVAFHLRSYGAEADKIIIDQIVDEYGFDPICTAKSLKALAAIVAKRSFENNIDDLLIPMPLKQYLKGNVIFG
jgi:ankyrin repeat protein